MAVSEKTQAILDDVKRKADILTNIDPYFIDLSLRENVFGSNVGQTLQNKLDILPKLRAFGFQNILFGTLDYSMPDAPEVDDDFMQYLRDNGIDMTGGFAFTDIGRVGDGGQFAPSISMRKLASYGVPNTLHEIYLSPEGMAGQYTFQQLMDSIQPSIEWLLANVKGDRGGKPRIIINVVDGCDAFAQNAEQTEAVLSLLANLPAGMIEGVSIEDDRGTYMPFQVGGFVQIARSLLPAPLKLLVHMHSGGGFENASVIEALLNGADGAWGGLPKRAAIIGHASLGELISNLMRVGNPNMAARYRVQQLLPLCTSLQEIDTNTTSIPDDEPILGANAYRLTLSFFEQSATRYMDLPPDRIGGAYGYRVCAVAADPPVLRGRLVETTGRPPTDFPDSVMEEMIRIMRADLRAGTRTDYDPPDQVWKLYQRALQGKGTR